MLVGQRKHVEYLLKNSPDWWPLFGTSELEVLCAINLDVCGEDVEIVNHRGDKKTLRKIQRRLLGNPIEAYETLRKHRRVPKSEAAETAIKKLKE